MASKNREGGLLTTQDVLDLIEFQDCLYYLPYIYRKYYILKAGYFALRSKTLALLISGGIIALGILAYFQSKNLVTAILLFILGIIVGVVLIWEIESNKHNRD